MVQSVIKVCLPDSRELLWVSPDSAVASWQTGDLVDFRGGRWIVLERSEEAGALTLTLAVGPEL